MEYNQWINFKDGVWKKEINLREFIQLNYKSYDGDHSFIQGPTKDTLDLWDKALVLIAREQERGGVLSMDTGTISRINSHRPGYLDKSKEKIHGFQTDKPLKRPLQPYGGIRTSLQACELYGYEISEDVKRIFFRHRKTHNQGVYDAYTPTIRRAKKSGIITGLPDAYGRGRIIGDYRRVALYGVNFLIEEKRKEKELYSSPMTEDTIRLREEAEEQIRALYMLIALGTKYGYDISIPASNATEAFQWLYFGYLASVKEQNGAAMSLGRVSTFLDIYIERDFETGILTESLAQELVDNFVMKLRLVRFSRTPEYNDLFSGDPNWITESIGGMTEDHKSLVTKNSFRFLQTLYNLGPAPEPNLTVLWDKKLPDGFKSFCAKVSIDTSSIQYESDRLMRPVYGDDYSISCCVSPMRTGKEMQYFGARANLPKALLYAINGGVDEITKVKVVEGFEPITSDYLNYDEVMTKFDKILDWLSVIYVDALNIIHYMHDKYCYERIQMALHDLEIKRNFATGIAGLSVVADSLSAIKYAKVKVIRDEDGTAIEYETEGDFPRYGNNIDEVDFIARDLITLFMNKIRKHKTHRNSLPTMSILTITSNVVYGKKTGSTPCGRLRGEPFAPGANPMHGRDKNGALASLSSVSKLPFADASDGISNTFTIIPGALGKDISIVECKSCKN